MTAAPSRLLLVALRVVALTLGAANAGAAMLAESMNEDGIHYLDQGDAWMRGDWGMAINGTWSPLYPVILGLVMRAARPSIAWEFPLVQLVNFGVFVLALVCFDFFWREATERYYAPALEETTEPDRFPPWMFLVMGYGVFIWSTTSLIRLFAVTPDMLVAAFVFLAAGYLLRLVDLGAGRRDAAALGAALGAAYLAKAAMFPLGIAMLAVAGTVLVRSHRSIRLLLPGVAAFMLVAGSFLVPLSVNTGRLTFSEVGRTSYLRHVLHAPFPHYESGSPNLAGEPLHPIARSTSVPPVYRFDGAVGGTYPLVYDQGYWYEGVRGRINPRLQFQAIAINLQRYFGLFFREQGAMTGIALVLLILLWRGYQQPFASGGWALELAAFAAFGMYGLVYAEGRYLAPFVVLLWAGLLITVRLRPEPGQPAWLRACGLAFILAVAVNIGSFHLDGFNALVRIAPVVRAGPVSRSAAPDARPSEVAGGLRELRLQGGDSIGVIGNAIGATWARLARFRIVADVADGDADDFWVASPDQQRMVLAAFAAAGVRAVIAEPPAGGNAPPDWVPVGRTGYLAKFIAAGEGQPALPAPNR